MGLAGGFPQLGGDPLAASPPPAMSLDLNPYTSEALQQSNRLGRRVPSEGAAEVERLSLQTAQGPIGHTRGGMAGLS